MSVLYVNHAGRERKYLLLVREKEWDWFRSFLLLEVVTMLVNWSPISCMDLLPLC